MAQRVISNVDGITPVVQDDGKGIGPVTKAGGLGVVLAGVISGLVVGICAVFGIVLDPVLVSSGTSLLGAALSITFMYYTPSKKIVEVVEVITNRDLDTDGDIGIYQADAGVTPTESSNTYEPKHRA